MKQQSQRSVELALKTFLNERHIQGKPLLLAVSGGADSLALLFAMVNCHSCMDGPIHVAHVDHGWRKSSGQEAAYLKELVRLKTPFHFHCRTIEQESPNNLEEKARQARLTFFQELTKELGCQAVLLAHHRQDCAETVFKRLMEESPLYKLAGLRSVHFLAQMAVWRPFLQLDKSQLVEYVRRFSVSVVEDVTNFDSRFYRGKLRQEVFPLMEKYLQRSVIEPLARLGRRGDELENYLEERTNPYLEAIEKGPLGIWVDLSSFVLHRLELRYFLRRFCEKGGMALSSASLEKACECVELKSSHRQFHQGKYVLIVDRSRLFLPRPDLLQLSLPEEQVMLKEGATRFGPWRIQVGLATSFPLKKGWQALWKGAVGVKLPGLPRSLGRPKMAASLVLGKEMGDWMTTHRIPVFLRSMVPVIFKGFEVEHEFLTGGRLKEEKDAKLQLELQLEE